MNALHRARLIPDIIRQFETMRILKRVVFLLCIPLSVQFGQIANGKHDLSYTSSSAIRTSSDQYRNSCIFCHTSHTPAESGDMLWNRSAPRTTYTVYSSPTMEAEVPQPGTASKNCLSCHDGTIAYAGLLTGTHGAPPSFSGAGVMDTTGISSSAGLGTDLSNDHPIGFVYSRHQQSDQGLRPASMVKNRAVVRGIAEGYTLPLSGSSTGTATMECITCHDPHGVPTVPAFLRASNEQSKLCFTCHIK